MAFEKSAFTTMSVSKWIGGGLVSCTGSLTWTCYNRSHVEMGGGWGMAVLILAHAEPNNLGRLPKITMMPIKDSSNVILITQSSACCEIGCTLMSLLVLLRHTIFGAK